MRHRSTEEDWSTGPVRDHRADPGRGRCLSGVDREEIRALAVSRSSRPADDHAPGCTPVGPLARRDRTGAGPLWYALPQKDPRDPDIRTEHRRVWKECVRTCSSLWAHD